MSNINPKILKYFSIKPDDLPIYIEGRVTETASHDFQVELKDANGNYLPVYNPQAIAQNSEIKEGDDVYLSPQFYLDAFPSTPPGQAYPYKAELAKPENEAHLRDPAKIYFDASKEGKGYYGLPKKYLIRAGDSLLTQEAKAILEKFSVKKEVASVRIENYKNPFIGDPIFNLYQKKMAKIDSAFNKIARGDIPSMEELVAMIDQVKEKTISPIQAKPETKSRIVESLDKILKNTKILKPMVAYLLEKREALGKMGEWPDNAWSRRLQVLIPALKSLLVDAGETELPATEELAQLSEAIVALSGAVLIAAAKRGEAHPVFAAVLDRFSKSSFEPHRSVVALSARNLLGEKAIPYLIALTKEKSAEIRTKAYQELAYFLPDEAVARKLENGFQDEEYPIQVLIAATFLEHGDGRLTPTLIERLEKYMESEIRRREKMLPPFTLTAAFTKVGMMDDPIENGISLKDVALACIGQFGAPLNFADVLAQWLQIESNENDLQFSAQALEKIDPQKAVEAIWERLINKPSPDNLYFFGIELTQKNKSKGKLAQLYRVAIQHPNEEVRQTALNIALALDPVTIRAWLAQQRVKQT